MGRTCYKLSNKKSKSVKLENDTIPNTVYTEAKLQKMVRSMKGLCHFCNTREETLKHLFYDCTVIQQNWVKTLSAIQK